MQPSPKKQIITVQDLYRFQLISECAISPDGQCVVFCLHRVDQETEKKYANLWIVPTNGGPARQFTWGNQLDINPQWSPDGRQIAFLSNRGDKEQFQLYIIPFGGGEARPLTHLQGHFGSFQWSPDGTRFVCTFCKKDQEVIEREKDKVKKELGLVARRITRIRYKMDGSGFLPQERMHVWTINAHSGTAQQLTASDVSEETEPCWSPDGREIVFVSNTSDDPDFYPEAMDLFIILANGSESGQAGWRKIPAPHGRKQKPTFSPDGRWIAYLGRKAAGNSWDSWKNTGLWIAPANGQGSARNLTRHSDRHVGNGSLNDLGGMVTAPPHWSQDSQTLYFQMSHHGNTTLHAISIADAKAKIRPVINDAGVVGTYSIAPAPTRLAYFFTNATSPGQIWLCDLPDGATRQLTHFNQDWLDEIELGEIDQVWWPRSAGNDLQGWILKPPGFDPAQQYPSILQVHGGPLMQYANVFMHEFYCLAAQGYVVYFCNPRGGRGYGEAHAKATLNNMGGPDYADLMAWVDWVAQKPYIDTERMGVTGGSYGGYMTNFIISRTHRFKAAVTQRCISNRISDFGSKDTNWRRKFVFDHQTPWENVEDYWRQSPLKYIGNAKTPTLIIHSEQDYMCALEQAEQLFVALKVLDVETELIIFPQESHSLSRTGRTDRRVERLRHILRWFDRYLKDNSS